MTCIPPQGLEFDDVYLVNFFQDSPAAGEWRVLLSYLEELEALVRHLKIKGSYLNFTC